MTSSSWPSSAASSALFSAVATIGPYATTVTSWPGRTIRARSKGGAWSAISPLAQYLRLGSKKITGSSDRIACWIIQYASDGLAQATTFSPAVCAKYASGDSEWCSTAPIPPPNGMRIVIGIRSAPAERLCILATWLTIWSNPG